MAADKVVDKVADKVGDTAGGKAACILAGMVVDKVDGSIQVDCNHREPLVVCMPGWAVVLRTPGERVDMVEVVLEVVAWVARPRAAVVAGAFVQEHCRHQQGRNKPGVDP